MSNAEVLDRGMSCLLGALGSIETERFISVLSQERFDYTKWQREKFDDVDPDDFYRNALLFEENHPFSASLTIDYFDSNPDINHTKNAMENELFVWKKQRFYGICG